MSVTVSKADGVTVLTMVSDPNGRLPPLCQVLKALSHSLGGCSEPPHMKRLQRASLLVLGTLHIMIGLLSISLGIILHFSESWCELTVVPSCPFWSGSLFAVIGIICILCEKKPCLYLILPNMFLNFVGIFGAVGAIFLYSINISGYYSGCGRVYGPYYHEFPIRVLSEGISGVLIALSALELCVAVSALALTIKVLTCCKRNENLSCSEPEQTTNPGITEGPYEICIIST
ncbi:uncharacterized protein LOC122831825 [Gambusia affinis]|uniref:uncharacterized protein LOC122831825 n=1 Tax=Gambusia affinis TaxID=33528 RepID=UPI001CDBC394|nr:uncharacterized protein LOC122831825 [Gambusia affinis]